MRVFYLSIMGVLPIAFLLPHKTHAQTENYTPLEEIPLLTNSAGNIDVTSANSLMKFGNTVVQIMIGVAIILAVIMVIISGVTYMTTGSFSKKGNAKDRITKALLGLLLALSSVVILQTINPNLVEIKKLQDIKVQESDIEGPDFDDETGTGWCAFDSFSDGFGKSGGTPTYCQSSVSECGNQDVEWGPSFNNCLYYGDYPGQEYLDNTGSGSETIKGLGEKKTCTLINFPGPGQQFYYCSTSVSACKKIQEKWRPVSRPVWGDVEIKKDCAVYDGSGKDPVDYIGGCYTRERKLNETTQDIKNRFKALSDYQYTDVDGNTKTSKASDRMAICKENLDKCLKNAYHKEDDDIFDGRPATGEDETTGVGYYMTVNLYNEYSGPLGGLAGILHGQECKAYPKNFSSQGDGSEIDWCFTWSGVPESASTPISGAACRADKNICQSDRQTTVDAYPDADISNCSQMGYSSSGGSDLVFNEMMQANIINGNPSESEVRDMFSNKGIGINKGPCTEVDPGGSCTNVGGMPQDTIDALEQLKIDLNESSYCDQSGCNFVVSGGTSWWFHGDKNSDPEDNPPDEKTYHNPTGLGLPTGAVDLAPTSGLNSYIVNNLGIPSGGDGCDNGNYFLDERGGENSHWHVVFDKQSECNN